MSNEKTPAERVRAHFDAAAAKRVKPANKATTEKVADEPKGNKDTKKSA